MLHHLKDQQNFAIIAREFFEKILKYTFTQVCIKKKLIIPHVQC